MFSTGFTSLSVLLIFPYWSPSLSLCTVFDSVLSNIDEILSINSSANVLISADFDIHHQDWLTYSGRTDRSGGTPTRIPDCDSHSPALLDLFISSDTIIFLSIGKCWSCCCLSFQWLYNKLKSNYSCADCDGLCDHLRDVPWEDIMKFSVSAAASEFCE